MEGYLKRWTGILTRWKLNYFILHKNILIYCAQKAGTTLGTIHLKISSILLIPDDPLRIIINSGTKEINLRAQNIDEKIKWVNALRTAQENSFKEDEKGGLDYNNLIKEDPNLNKESKSYFEKSDMDGIQDSLAEIWTLQAHLDEVFSLLMPKIEKGGLNELMEKLQKVASDLKVIIFMMKTYFK